MFSADYNFCTQCMYEFFPSRLGISHLVATNIAVVARTMVEETWGDFLLKYFKSDGYDGGYGGGKGKLIQSAYYTTPTDAPASLFEPTSKLNITYPMSVKTSFKNFRPVHSKLFCLTPCTLPNPLPYLS